MRASYASRLPGGNHPSLPNESVLRQPPTGRPTGPHINATVDFKLQLALL